MTNGKHLSIGGESSFEKACELILSKNAHMLVVVMEPYRFIINVAPGLGGDRPSHV